MQAWADLFVSHPVICTAVTFAAAAGIALAVVSLGRGGRGDG